MIAMSVRTMPVPAIAMLTMRIAVGSAVMAMSVAVVASFLMINRAWQRPRDVTRLRLGQVVAEYRSQQGAGRCGNELPAALSDGRSEQPADGAADDHAAEVAAVSFAWCREYCGCEQRHRCDRGRFDL